MKIIALLLVALPLFAEQPGPRPKKGGGGDGGPRAHVVLSASSKDGLAWTLDEGTRLEHASVPCAVVTDDGKVRVYFVDASEAPESANVAESEDGIHFKKLGLEIKGVPAQKALDPSALLLDGGMYVLYYFSCEANPDAAGSHEVRRAVSEDGVHFEDKGTAFSQEALVDPDVFWWKDRWYMYVFGRGNTVIATSKDGLEFTYMQDLDLKGWGTTAPIRVGDKLRLYAFDQRAHEANEVHSFASTDGVSWKEEPGVRLTAAKGEQYTDPQVVRWKGGYKMYFKRSASPR